MLPTMLSDPGRRSFMVRASRAVLGAGLLGAPWSLACAPQDPDRELALRLAACAPPTAAPVGAAYLSRHGDRGVADLAHTLTEGWPAEARNEAGERLCQRLSSQGRRDFDTGATVQLEGFVLSRTEVELAALALLLAT